jgi:hypothetical protein
MFWIAPIRPDLKKLRELLRLIEGNRAVTRIMDELLIDMLRRMERAIVADSVYWNQLIEKARKESDAQQTRSHGEV